MEVTKETLVELVGEKNYNLFKSFTSFIESKYEMDITWGKAVRNWIYEYKYRRGGKTLCGFYFQEGGIGLMIIFGKDERIKVEEARSFIDKDIMKEYDDATTYHDGKWVMFTNLKEENKEDILNLLKAKRKPNRR